jgi:enoyl-CoA hydratase/carnithine racemase
MTSSEIIGGVHVLHLGDGPNTVGEDFLAGVTGALDAIDADPEMVGLVITATGKAFSQGYDLNELAGLDPDAANDFVQRSVDVLARVLVAPVPTVAALNGHAFGYGAMLALACDVRVQRHDRGWFCLPEVDLGLRFKPLQLALVQAKLSAATAEEAVLTGRRYDGLASVAAGIASVTASETDLLMAGVALAATRGGKGRAVLTGLKQDLYADVLAVRTGPIPT